MAKDKFSRTKACATKTLYAVMKEMSRRARGDRSLVRWRQVFDLFEISKDAEASRFPHPFSMSPS